MRTRSVIGPLMGLLLLSSCTFGSGEVISEQRDVSGFERIELATSGDVVVQVTGTESVQIEAEENILPLLTTDVVDGTLVLGSERSFSTSRGIDYTITAATLQGVSITGSGDIEVTAVDGGTFFATIDGSGTIEASGRCETLAVEVGGSGTFDGAELRCPVGTASISGSGDALVDVTDVLDATVSGSGTIEYLGDPEVRTDISGSGDVTRG